MSKTRRVFSEWCAKAAAIDIELPRKSFQMAREADKEIEYAQSSSLRIPSQAA